MYLVKDFKNLCIAINEKYNEMKKEGGTTVYTYGIVFADASKIRVKSKLLNDAIKIDRLSSKYIHFYLPGYRINGPKRINSYKEDFEDFFDLNTYIGFKTDFSNTFDVNIYGDVAIFLLQMDGRDIENVTVYELYTGIDGTYLYSTVEEIVDKATTKIYLDDFKVIKKAKIAIVVIKGIVKLIQSKM